MNLQEKLENLKHEQERAKEVYVKLQGAIEFLNSLIEEQESSKKEKK